jgi:hypothetical protein
MIFDRDGKVSVLRVGLLALGIGVILLLGALISFFVDRAARQRPLDVAIYPNAVLVNTIDLPPVDRQLVYTVGGATPEDVVGHYQGRMNEFWGMATEPELRDCKRLPPVGNYENDSAGNPPSIPYEYICLFEASGINTTQYTRVGIQPGTGDYAGMVVIIYSQTWSL